MSDDTTQAADPSVRPDVERGEQTAGAGTERTGVPTVDRVLREIESVASLPVAERVAVFERAHEQLRRSLDADPTADVAGR